LNYAVKYRILTAAQPGRCIDSSLLYVPRLLSWISCSTSLAGICESQRWESYLLVFDIFCEAHINSFRLMIMRFVEAKCKVQISTFWNVLALVLGLPLALTISVMYDELYIAARKGAVLPPRVGDASPGGRVQRLVGLGGHQGPEGGAIQQTVSWKVSPKDCAALRSIDGCSSNIWHVSMPSIARAVIELAYLPRPHRSSALALLSAGSRAPGGAGTSEYRGAHHALPLHIRTCARGRQRSPPLTRTAHPAGR
jgi:hypothetical protein